MEFHACERDAHGRADELQAAVALLSRALCRDRNAPQMVSGFVRRRELTERSEGPIRRGSLSEAVIAR